MALIKFKPCSTFTVVGPSKIGKTYWMQRLIRQVRDVYESSHIPRKFYWFYSVWQPSYVDLEDMVTFKPGLPSSQDVNELTDGKTHTFFILDDLCSQAVKSEQVCDLFIRDSHHRALTVIMTTQNMFEQGKRARTIALSTEYLVLFRNPRDHQQIMYLARQLFPGKTKSFLDVYRDATAEKWGYLLIDLTAHGEEKYRLRSRVFADDTPVVYQV